MIATLRGTIHKLTPGEAVVDVQGVGYHVQTPLDVWEALAQGEERSLWISTYVREDRISLFGFLDRLGRTLFEELIARQGIGPRLGLELCAVPRDLLDQAITDQDPALLTSIKGIGKKTAEKVLLELRSLREKHPEMFRASGKGGASHAHDPDAIAALQSLGYDLPTILPTLKELPKELKTTEERVAAALRAL